MVYEVVHLGDLDLLEGAPFPIIPTRYYDIFCSPVSSTAPSSFPDTFLRLVCPTPHSASTCHPRATDGCLLIFHFSVHEVVRMIHIIHVVQLRAGGWLFCTTVVVTSYWLFTSVCCFVVLLETPTAESNPRSVNKKRSLTDVPTAAANRDRATNDMMEQFLCYFAVVEWPLCTE